MSSVANLVRRACKTLVLLEYGVPNRINTGDVARLCFSYLNKRYDGGNSLEVSSLSRRSQFKLNAKRSKPEQTSVANLVRLFSRIDATNCALAPP